MIVLYNNLNGHDRQGITTNSPMGSSWALLIGSGFDEMSCGFRQCAATHTNGSMQVTSRFAETDSPTIGSWHNIIYKNITEVAAYGESTLWVVDKNDVALQAINLQENNFINANWEPRGYHDSAKADFMQMTVTDKLAFGMAKGDGDIYVLTGNRSHIYCEKNQKRRMFCYILYVEFSNVHNSVRMSNATRSSLAYKNVL